MAESPGIAPGPPPPPDLNAQKRLIREHAEKQLRKNDTWCLIDTRWYKQWKKYVGFDEHDNSQLSRIGDASQCPGPIDNSGLFSVPNGVSKEVVNGHVDGSNGPQPTLKERLCDELDYVLVPQEGWDLLVSWYGVIPGQPPIVRQVVEHGMFVKNCKVEVYLVDFKLSQTDDVDNYVTKSFSKAATIEDIETEMKKLFNIPDNKETRLWNKFVSNTFEHLGKRDLSVQDAGLYQGQLLVIEPRNDDGSWPRGEENGGDAQATYAPLDVVDNDIPSPTPTSGSGGRMFVDNTNQPIGSSVVSSTSGVTPRNHLAPSAPSTSSYNSISSGGFSSASDYFGGGGGGMKRVNGLCGLSNLGNTCFMNSALQCLSNVPLLTRYILNDLFVTELNFDNPLGMGGQIAKAYAELIKQMWLSNNSYTIPRNFKMAVGRFAPQFSGYQQQDSQELMAFLLDGLHEDLNRIKKKPYVEVKDGSGRPDAQVAAESWQNYLKRNSSIIVDIFHGLLKSTLVCPDCFKVSVTFDPFCYLSLPLPMKKERQIDVFFISAIPAKRIVQYKLTVPKLGIVDDLCQALSKLTGVSHDHMIVTDVYNHRFHKVYNIKDSLSHILDRDDIFVYESPVTTQDDPQYAVVPVYWREKRNLGSRFNANVQYNLFGHPLFIPVARKGFTSRILYNAIIERTKRYVRQPPSTNNSGSDDEFGAAEREVRGEHEVDVDEDSRAEVDQFYDNDTGPDGVEGPSTETQATSAASNAPLFSFSIVNSYGSTDINQLPINDKPFTLSSLTYIAADWSTKMKETCFDAKEAEELDQHDSLRKPNLMKKQVVQLSECLELFITRETLGADDLWYCPSCKKHQQATKKFDVWSLPNILVIHLKRFSYNKYWRDKIDVLVEFPLKGLDMSEYVLDPACSGTTYDLIGVSNHFGGMGGGHYTAYAKNCVDDRWYNFDDSSVSSADEESVCSKAAYVLFYQRRGMSGSPTETSMGGGAAGGNFNNAVPRHSTRIRTSTATSSNGDSSSSAENSGGSLSSATSSPLQTSSNGIVVANGSAATTPNGTNGSSDDDSMETN